MPTTLEHKRFYAYGQRHQGECYQAVLDPRPGSRALAYLVIDGQRESLVWRESDEGAEVVIAADAYILSPCFAGGLLFWVERRTGVWRMRTASPAKPRRQFNPFDLPGRSLSLAAASSGERAWLAWEQRQGRRTISANLFS